MEIIKEHDNVRIKDKGVIGQVIDIYKNSNGESRYIVESNTPGYVDDPDAYPGEWPLYTCTVDQLELILSEDSK